MTSELENVNRDVTSNSQTVEKLIPIEIGSKSYNISLNDILRPPKEGEVTRKCISRSPGKVDEEIEIPIDVIKGFQSYSRSNETTSDYVQLYVPYDGHIIEITTKWFGKVFSTRYTIDDNKDGKSAISIEHKRQLYLKESRRDDDVREWLKRKFDIQKKYADDILYKIREEADSKQQLIDNLMEKNKNEYIVPGYENYAFCIINNSGNIVIDINEIARAIMEKLHIISYNKSIWEYRHGIYVKSDTQTHEEIVRIYRTLNTFCGSVSSLSKDVLYCIINNHHTYYNPFNTFYGIPVANGVVKINFETGEEELIQYSPDLKFSYKLPVTYNRSTSTEPVMKLLRSWVLEKDINTLIQIPAQALLQKIFLYTYKKFYLFNGARDSGKSSFTNFLTMTLSVQDENDPKCAFGFTKNYTSISLDKLTNNTFAKSGLVDKILNRHSDMTQFYLDDTGEFKELLGDVFGHNTERKHQDAQEDAITAVHVFSCNQLPFIANKVLQDDDFWPKMEYVYFPFHYKKKDNWETENLTEENCSAFFNLILDMMKKIKRQHCLVVDTDGAVTLDKVLEDSLPVMRFIKLNMKETHSPVQINRRLFMLAYVNYCKDKKINDMKEFEGIDQDIINKAINALENPEEYRKLMDLSTLTFEEQEERTQITKVMNKMTQSLANFTKNLKKTNKFKVVHTTINEKEIYLYEGNWLFKENSKYKVSTQLKW